MSVLGQNLTFRWWLNHDQGQLFYSFTLKRIAQHIDTPGQLMIEYTALSSASGARWT